jgi:predicted nuclease with TOPRIM domain
MNSNETTKDLTEDLTPDAPDTAPLLKELLSDFREFRAEARAQWALDDVRHAQNEAFQAEAMARFTTIETRLGAIEREQSLMRREMGKHFIAMSRYEARLEELEDQVGLPKAA